VGRFCDKCHQMIETIETPEKRWDITATFEWTSGEDAEEHEKQFDLCERCLKIVLESSFNAKLP